MTKTVPRSTINSRVPRSWQLQFHFVAYFIIFMTLLHPCSRILIVLDWMSSPAQRTGGLTPRFATWPGDTRISSSGTRHGNKSRQMIDSCVFKNKPRVGAMISNNTSLVF